MSKWNNKYLSIALYSVLAFTACLFVYLFIMHFSAFISIITEIFSILSPIVYGFIIAYLINPILNIIERIFSSPKIKEISHKTKRVFALVAAYLLIFSLIGVFILIITPQLIESLTAIINNLGTFSKTFLSWAENVIKDFTDLLKDVPYISDQREELMVQLREAINSSVDFVKELVPGIIKFLTTFSIEIVNLFVGFIISIYMLYDKEKFIAQTKKIVCASFSLSFSKKLINFGRNLNETIGNFISGKILDCIIVGCLIFIALSIFSIPYALLISVIIAITNFIPFFGPFIGVVPCAIILIMVDPMSVIWFVIIDFVVQQIDGNIIGPKIVGRSIGLGAFWVIVGLLISGGIFGIWGMLLGAPVFAVIYNLLSSFFKRRLQKKALPDSTEYYYTYEHHEPFVNFFDGDAKENTPKGNFYRKVKNGIDGVKEKVKINKEKKNEKINKKENGNEKDVED